MNLQRWQFAIQLLRGVWPVISSERFADWVRGGIGDVVGRRDYRILGRRTHGGAEREQRLYNGK